MPAATVMCADRQFDVVFDDPNGPMILASFAERDVAKAAMEDLASHVPGEYFLWRSHSGEVIARLNRGSAATSGPRQAGSSKIGTPGDHILSLTKLKKQKEIE